MLENFKVNTDAVTTAASMALSLPVRYKSIRVGNIAFSQTAPNSPVYFNRLRPNRELLATAIREEVRFSVFCTEPEKRAILTIVAHPVTAARNYGKDSKTCSVCRSNLITAVARAAGVHRECAENMGWSRPHLLPDNAIDSPIK